LAEVVSFFGDWFNTIALYVAVEELSGRAEAISAVFIAKLLPVFLMTPVAGPLIDRFDRRKLLLATDLGRAVAAVGLIVAYRAGNLPLLLVLLVGMVCFSGVFIPAKTAVLPQLVHAEQLGVANALSAGTWSVMLALGAAIGGMVTAVVGIELSLAFDALTFLLSAAFIFPLPSLLPDSSQVAATDRGFMAGLRYLRRRPSVAAAIALKSCLALGGGAIAMLPMFATRVFGGVGAAAVMGVLCGARGIGSLVGSLLVRRVFGDRPHTMRRLMIPAFVVVAVSYAGLSRAALLWQAALAYGGAAVGGGTIWVYSTTLGQLASDDAYRGRVFSVEWGGLTLVMSGVAAGAAAMVDYAGWSVRDVAAATAAAMIVPVLLWGVVMRSHHRLASRAGS